MHETTTTVRIFADGEFRIAIVETKNMYEYWLNHIKLGTASFIYALQKKDITFEEFKIMIKNELKEMEEAYLEDLQTIKYIKNNVIKEESNETQNTDKTDSR